MRAVKIFIAILCLSAGAEMLDRSGFNDHLGMSPDHGVSSEHLEDVDGTQEDIEDTVPDLSDFLGFAITAVAQFLNIFVLLGPIETGLYNIGFPEWFVWPVMWIIVRPIYYFGAIQFIRGVVVET